MADDEMSLRCRACGQPVPGSPQSERDQASPCPKCGSVDKDIAASGTVRVRSIIEGRARTAPPNRDRELPNKGEITDYHGQRRGRDGRIVNRNARYDPYTDTAFERVVDADSGEIIVEKTEKLTEKYMRSGRWKPPA